MQQMSNLPVFTGTIPNKATQNDTDFANNIFGFLNYSGNSFVIDFNTIIGEFNTLSDEIELVASSASQSASSAADYAQSAAQSANAAEFTTGLLAAGTINNIVIGADKTFSNEFLLTLLNNPIDIEEINISAASDIDRNLADNDLIAIHNSVNQTTVKSTVSRIWTYISGKLTGAISNVLTTNLTSLKVLVSDINGKIVASGVSLTTLNYLSNVTSDIQNQINAKLDDSSKTPTGTIITFASSTAPTGYLKANGALLSRTTYAALFTAIGTTFGVGDGSTTFALPDLRGYFPRGWDDGRGIDTSRVFGSNQGDAYLNHSHTGSTDSQGAHTHTVAASIQGIFSGQQSTTYFPAAEKNGTISANISTSSSVAHTHTVTVATSTTGATETRPKNIALLYCIKY